jgi:hypothetical protein
MAKSAKRQNAKLDGPFPLHRGPFLFAPHFLSEANWYSEFQSLATRTLRDLKINAEIHPNGRAELKVEFDKFELAIDGRHGAFGLFERGFSKASGDVSKDDDFDLSQWMGPVCGPAQFLDELKNPEIIRILADEHKSIDDFASLIFVHMKKRFNKALREGIGEITGCVGSPASEPTVFDFRLLDYLKFNEVDRDPFSSEEDLVLDDAEVKTDGVLLFLLGVSPVRRGLKVSQEPDLTLGKRRGAPKIFEPDLIIEAIVKLLLAKGEPSASKYGAWTWEALAKELKAGWGVSAPSRNTIFNQKIPAIAKYKKLRAQKSFQQSNK